MLNSHDSLGNYYITNFNIMYYMGDKNFDILSWDEKLLPFERMMYLELLNQKLTEEAKQKAPDPLFSGEPTGKEFGEE